MRSVRYGSCLIRARSSLVTTRARVRSHTVLDTPMTPMSCSQLGPSHQRVTCFGGEADRGATRRPRRARRRRCGCARCDSGPSGRRSRRGGGQRPVEHVRRPSVPPERRVEGDDLVPRLAPPGPVSDLVGVVAETVDERRVELRPSALGGDGDGGRGAARVGGRPRCCRRGGYQALFAGATPSTAPARPERPCRPSARTPGAAGVHTLPRREARAGRRSRSPALAGALFHHSLHRTSRRREEVPDHADANHR